MDYLDRITERFGRKRVLSVAAAVNLAGALFGFYYYLPQFGETPVYLWILVADSPIATLLAAGAYISRTRDFSSAVLDSLAFLANLKYGLWTVFVLLYYSESFLSFRSGPMFAFLVISHLLMALQALFLLEDAKMTLGSTVAAFSMYVINDLVDYGLGIHTSLPETNSFGDPAGVVAFSLTTVCGVLLLSQAQFLQEKSLI